MEEIQERNVDVEISSCFKLLQALPSLLFFLNGNRSKLGKVLDAPQLQDDFYLPLGHRIETDTCSFLRNLVDWSPSNVLSEARMRIYLIEHRGWAQQLCLSLECGHEQGHDTWLSPSFYLLMSYVMQVILQEQNSIAILK